MFYYLIDLDPCCGVMDNLRSSGDYQYFSVNNNVGLADNLLCVVPQSRETVDSKLPG